MRSLINETFVIRNQVTVPSSLVAVVRDEWSVQLLSEHSLMHRPPLDGWQSKYQFHLLPIIDRQFGLNQF